MANKYWVGVSAAASNWNTTGPTPWSDTDGGANNAVAPGATDDVIFNGNGAFGNSSSVINGTRTILSLTITSGYTATMTHNAVLTINGNMTLGANYTIAGSSSLSINATSTITSNGKTWPNNMTWSTSTKTITLVGDFTITGLLTMPTNSSTALNKTSSEKLYLNGGLTQGINGNIDGTSEIVLGGGTWSSTASSGYLNINTTFNGNVILGTNVYFTNKILAYSGGSVTTTGSTLNLLSDVTFDTNSLVFNVILLPVLGRSFTLNSILRCATLNLNTNGNHIFTGSFGWICDTLSCPTIASQTITLQESVTYTITTALSAYFSRVGSVLIFASSHASNKANLTLVNGADCKCLAAFTRIDASGGRPIRSFNGVCTDTINIQSISDLSTVASAA